MTNSSTNDLKDEIARFVKSRPTDRVLFASELAEAVALVAGVAPGDVLTLDLSAALTDPTPDGDHRVVPAQIDLVTTLAAVDSELERRPAALLIVPAVAEATGEVVPLPALAAIAHRRGARLLVDGSELVSRRAVNLTSHGIDYLVLSGRSVAGPAVVVGRGDWLADCADADSADTVAGNVGTEWSPARALADLGYESAGLHEQALSEWLDAEVARHPRIRRLQLWPDVRDRVGIASLTVAGHGQPTVLRWDAHTGIDELARQLNSLVDSTLEQEKS